MDKYSITIIILISLCITLLCYLLREDKNKENFQESESNCEYTYREGDTHSNCIIKCIEFDENNCNTDKCKKICDIASKKNNPCIDSDGLTNCNIDPRIDITGNNINACINTCKERTCEGCKKYVIRDPISGIKRAGEFTNRKEDLDRCDSTIQNYKYCGPCVKACARRMDELALTKDENAENRINQFNERNPPGSFRIGVVPRENKLLVIWNETSNEINFYNIYIYKKANINLDDDNRQASPLSIKTISIPFNGIGNKQHEITGLTNGVTYSVVVNKISNHVEPQTIISNTIDAVPSKVDIINFSDINRDNTLKQRDLLSLSLLKDITGKTFDISL